MLAQRISSINSLSALCEKTGANVNELSKAIGLDHRIGPHFLRASVGFGGSCFQKDILNLVYLCKYYKLFEVAEYWHQVVKINDFQKNRIAKKIIDHFGENLSKIKIAIFGWAFKPNTNDSRESPAIYISEILYQAGGKISIYDPKIKSSKIFEDINKMWNNPPKTEDINKKIKVLREPFKEIKKYDAIAILTEWEIFKSYNWENLPKNILVINGIG